MARLLVVAMLGIAMLAAALVAQPQATQCQLRLELVDSKTGRPLSGMIQVRDAQGQLLPLDGLVNRGQGVESPGPIHDWWALPRPETMKLPAAKLQLRAVCGLETEVATTTLDLTGQPKAEHKIALHRIADERRDGYLAGNTHLHLMKLSKPQADRYLGEVPLVDGLEIVFLSYLERAGADLDYTSNKYTLDELHRLSHEHLRFGHGQEHRHNFGSHGEGYGHILLLDIPLIIRPVSIGRGIMREGPDSPPLQAGIDQARRAGGKIIWAHNLYGFEDIPNWITGRVHANNIYDGSHRGTYADTYYRYLNIGLRVPFSTGTDWFIYDFSRVYVQSDTALTPTGWLDRLALGKTYITNGPLLRFTVDDQPIGSLIERSQAGMLKVRGSAVGRADFQRLEVVHNGQVIHQSSSRAEAGHFVAECELELPIEKPSWLALRVPPPSQAGKTVDPGTPGVNDFGAPLFAHTSPIYVRFAGNDVFDADVARGLIDEMRSDWKQIEKQAEFGGDEQRLQVAHVYEEAIEILERRLEQP